MGRPEVSLADRVETLEVLLAARIEALDPTPEAVIVVTLDRAATVEQADHIRQATTSVFGGRRTLVVAPGASVEARETPA